VQLDADLGYLRLSKEKSDVAQAGRRPIFASLRKIG
jgi:hypothetical protein